MVSATSPPDPTACATCNQVHLDAQGKPSCVRHGAGGKPCRRQRMRGVKVCATPNHGAKSPTIRARHDATVAGLAMGLEPAVVAANPLQALRAYATETAHQYRSIKDDLADMLTTLDGAVYVDKAGVERIAAKVTIFERVCDRLERSLEALAKLNIDERLTRLEEAKVAYVISAIEAALEAAGFDDIQRADARLAIANELARGRPQLSRAAG